MLVGDEADDKIVAVLKSDAIFGANAEHLGVPRRSRAVRWPLFPDVPAKAGPRGRCGVSHVNGRADAHVIVESYATTRCSPKMPNTPDELLPDKV